MDCCGRGLCSGCAKNPRLRAYCPFCQDVSDATRWGLGKEVGGKDGDEGHIHPDDPPPAYDFDDRYTGRQNGRTDFSAGVDGKATSSNQGALIHHIQPEESLTSLSLLYATPPTALLDINKHIPRAVLTNPSLLHAVRPSHIRLPNHIKAVRGQGSKEPVSDVERAYQIAIRRTQLQTKETVYEVAKFYVDEAAAKIRDSHRFANEKNGDGDASEHRFPSGVNPDGSEMSEWVSMATRLWADDSDWEKGQFQGQSPNKKAVARGPKSIF